MGLLVDGLWRNDWYDTTSTVTEAVQNTVGGLLGNILPIPNPPPTSQPAP